MSGEYSPPAHLETSLPARNTSRTCDVGYGASRGHDLANLPLTWYLAGLGASLTSGRLGLEAPPVLRRLIAVDG